MKAPWIYVAMLLCLGTPSLNSQAKPLSGPIRDRLLAMKGFYGETDTSLSFERTHWRDEIWPYYSRVPWNGATICEFGSFTAFRIDRYSEMVEILSAIDLREGTVLARSGVRPHFGLKCTSTRDTALVLVSLTSGLVQISMANGPIVNGRLGAVAMKQLARFLARAGAEIALVPRRTDKELPQTVQLRDRWRRECSGCLLPPKAGIVYYDTPVRRVTPIELPDSLRVGNGTLLLWVSEDGTTPEIRFPKPRPHGEALLEAIKWQTLRFTPAAVAGKAIGAWVELSFMRR